MDAPDILMSLRGDGSDPDGSARQAVTELVAGTTAAEQAAVITAMRRGATWDQASDWLRQARREASSMEEGVYDRALGLFGGSTVLEWKECLDIAPALVYRLGELPLTS